MNQHILVLKRRLGIETITTIPLINRELNESDVI